MTRLPADFAAATAGLYWLLRAKRLHARLPAADLLDRLRAPPPPPSGHRVDPQRIRWALAGWSRRLPWRSDCLIQSLAARLWLDHAGVPCAFHLGAQRTGDGLRAHAWIEIDGAVATGGRAVEGLAGFAAAGDARSGARAPSAP